MQYSGHKATDERWLGQVPQHWDIRPLKATVEGCINGIWGDSPENDGTDLVCVRVADFDRQRFRIDTSDMTLRSVPPRQRGPRLLQTGDLLLEKSGGGEKQPVGAVVLVDERVPRPAVSSNFIARMPVAAGYDSRFLAYLHAALYSARVNTRSIKQSTGIQNLDSGAYLSENIASPPLQEQQAIANFLDRKTAEIDALLAEKQRLLELLEEKGSALITQAVTKGLDPDVEMKDSGVEWLGEIPAHWEVKRLCHVGEAIIGLTYSPADVVGKHAGTLVLRAANVSGGRVVFNGDVFVQCDIPAKLITRPRDILICSRSGSRSLIGKNAILSTAESGMTFGAFMTVFRSPVNEYLYYVFNSGLFEYQAGQYLTSTINQLTLSDLRNFQVPIPPPDEAAAIRRTLANGLGKVDQLMAETERAATLLHEYRTALISAAVTGKIDVREEAA